MKADGEISTPIDELKEALKNVFHTSKEKVETQPKMLKLKMRNNIDKHIEDFRELLRHETLTQILKEEMAE